MNEFHVVNQLSAFLDHELPDTDRHMVSSHLESCASCRAVYEDLSLLSASIKAESLEVRVPDSLADRILMGIQAAEARIKQRRSVGIAVFLFLMFGIGGFAWFLTRWGIYERKLIYYSFHVLYKSLSIFSSLATGYRAFFIEMLLISFFILVLGTWGLARMLRNFAVSG